MTSLPTPTHQPPQLSVHPVTPHHQEGEEGGMQTNDEDKVMEALLNAREGGGGTVDLGCVKALTTCFSFKAA
jgi:hypothetical protein